MMIAIKPKMDTILKAIPINLKPIFKNKGPKAQNNNIKPIIIAIIPIFLIIYLLLRNKLDNDTSN